MDNTPAFPTYERFSAGAGPLDLSSQGMTLRDYFAAKAMQVNLAQCNSFPDESWRHGVALDAYKMADAMMAARVQQ